jgi:hypothetical protein
MNLGVTIAMFCIDKDGNERLAIGGLGAAIPIQAIRRMSSERSKEPPAVLKSTTDVVSKQTQLATLLDDYDFALQGFLGNIREVNELLVSRIDKSFHSLGVTDRDG